MRTTEPFQPGPPAADSTAAYDPSRKPEKAPTPRVPMGLVGPSGTSPTEELQVLLRKRMKVVSVIGLCVAFVTIIVILPGALASGYWQLIAIYSTLQEILPGFPADVETVVLRCLEKDPQRRFPDVAQVELALHGCRCADDWTEARAGEWWERHK
jgi:hypothetical protein